MLDLEDLELELVLLISVMLREELELLEPIDILLNELLELKELLELPELDELLEILLNELKLLGLDNELELQFNI